MSEQNSLYWHDWFDTDGKEIPFNGNGGKRLKFCATKDLFARFGITTGAIFDEDLVHVDDFTWDNIQTIRIASASTGIFLVTMITRKRPFRNKSSFPSRNIILKD